MTSEEINRAIEFTVQHSANVSVHLQELAIGLKDLRESTARFQAWATEVVAIQSSRLDQNEKRLEQNDQWRQDMLELQRQALRLLNRILDKL